MKKLLAITGALLIAYLILTAIVMDGASAPAANTAEYTADQTAGGYVVADHNGRVAVFMDGRLIKSTDTPTASLPKADRVRLEQGIEVLSEKELKLILEDLCS